MSSRHDFQLELAPEPAERLRLIASSPGRGCSGRRRATSKGLEIRPVAKKKYCACRILARPIVGGVKASMMMNTQDFTVTFSVDRTPEEVFAAINDVRNWWTGEIEGPTDVLGACFTCSPRGDR